MKKNLLAIESSCDDTSVAIMQQGQLLSHIVTPQKVHATYGGIVPQLASTHHQKNILPTVQKALKEASIMPKQLNAIAYTQGPGLIGSLLIGSSFAKGLSYALDKPLIAVHHMKAHVLANFIEKPTPTFPFLSLIISGGHTQLILVKNHLDMQLLGQTKDDAIGEAFDKIGKIMNLPYPGGVSIDQYAKTGNPQKFPFPTSQPPDFHFSFSGIKTAFLYFIQNKQQQDPNFIIENRNDLCASIQAALIDIIISKVAKALHHTKLTQLALGGGVAANSSLRKKLRNLSQKKHFTLYIPKPQYCTDNAAMIAMTAHYQMQSAHFNHYQTPSLARMPL